jgi:DNA-binding CsgD family transcriptional regulator
MPGIEGWHSQPEARLTSRELEVLMMMAEGARNAEIATRLVIAQTTVNSHVRNILGKLGARNRTEAVAQYLRGQAQADHREPMTDAQRDSDRAPTYEVRVRGQLDEMMLVAFPELAAEPQGDDTLLRGVLPDQSALHGVLAQIETLGLELLEVRRLPPA